MGSRTWAVAPSTDSSMIFLTSLVTITTPVLFEPLDNIVRFMKGFSVDHKTGYLRLSGNRDQFFPDGGLIIDILERDGQAILFHKRKHFQTVSASWFIV